MKMINLLAICPYNISMIKALSNVVTAKMANVTIVGEERRVIELCYIYGFNKRLFKIINAKNDIDICLEANDELKKQNFDVIIYGYLSAEFHKNIAISDVDINIIDIPKVNHLVFAPINIMETFISFDEKIDAIIKTKSFMSSLHLNKCNIGLVEDRKSKTAMIEKNVIHLNPELVNDVIDIISVKSVFNDDYNIVIFNSKNALNIFLDTILIDRTAKHACIKKAPNNYIIDAYEMNSKDIFFSIFLVNKICLKSEAC
jgi:hypothetical protein